MAAKKTPSKKASKAATSNVGPMPPYGVPIHDAIKRGDKAEMKRLLGQAQKTLKDNEKLQTAVAKLQDALKKG